MPLVEIAAKKTPVDGPATQAMIHYCLGTELGRQKRYAEAQIAFEKAIEISPDDATFHRSLGTVLADQEKFDEADTAFQKAASLPDGKPIWRWKPLGFCPAVFPDEHSIEEYWSNLNERLDEAIAEDIPIDWRTLPRDGCIPSFNLPHHGKCCREVREKFYRLYSEAFPQESPKSGKSTRLRIGFHVVTGHEGGFLRGTAGIIERLDPKRFEPIILCNKSIAQRIREGIQRESLSIIQFDGSFEQKVAAVKAAECDLIYYRKAGSDPTSYFFPFARCAPVQVTSYGTHGTSGIGAIDWFLSSTFVEPHDGQQYYTERLHNFSTLPTFQRRAPALSHPASREEFNLPSKGAIYFCPHRPPKYHPGFDTLIRTILERDPTGYFVLLAGQNQHAFQVLLERLRASLGNPLLRRVRFFPALPQDQYFRLFSLATMILDSPVYAGGLTSFDAFAFGIPEVTLSGPLHIQNFATGIYRRMGLGDLPCATPQEYIDLAVKLGTEPDFRESVRVLITERSHEIFEEQGVVEEHERFFEMACER